MGAVDVIEEQMGRTGRKLLWGTANLFSHPRYAAGAATNPDPEVFAYAAAQVKVMLEVTKRLGGANYVLWGGREGYETLLNTDMKRELDQFGRFLALVAEHKHKIGFEGTLLIEPKPQEPTKHQYDYDAASIYAFLQTYGLENEYRTNLEVNHATLAGHTFHHEVVSSYACGIFGSVDINRGDYQNGWDTDQFPNSVEEICLPMHEILQEGGFTTGGFNFDTKLRRQSMSRDDLFLAHIGGMDTLAMALLVAADMLERKTLEGPRAERYAAGGPASAPRSPAGASPSPISNHASHRARSIRTRSRAARRPSRTRSTSGSGPFQPGSDRLRGVLFAAYRPERRKTKDELMVHTVMTRRRARHSSRMTCGRSQ